MVLNFSNVSLQFLTFSYYIKTISVIKEWIEDDNAVNDKNKNIIFMPPKPPHLLPCGPKKSTTKLN